jgi:arsenate reductase (thioredoxin)
MILLQQQSNIKLYNTNMKILFICNLNVNRSQMAEAFFNHFSKKHQSKSAGTKVHEKDGEPIKNVSVMVTETMNELGYDLSNKVRSQVTKQMVDDADMVISFADKSTLPEFVVDSPKLEIWQVPGPEGKDYEFHKKVRDQIRGMVNKLVQEIED